MNNINMTDVIDKIRAINTAEVIENDIAEMIKNLNIKHVIASRAGKNIYGNAYIGSEAIIIASNKRKMNWGQDFGYNEDEIRITFNCDLSIEIDVPVSKKTNKYGVDIIYKSTLSNPKVFNDIKRIVKKHFKDFAKKR